MTKTNSMCNGTLPWNTSETYQLTPNISRKTRYGTQIAFNMLNPLAINNNQSGFVYNPTASLSITQPLLKGSGRLINEAPLIEAYNSAAVARLNYKNVVMTDITTIINDYYAVVGQENALRVDLAGLKSAKQTVANNKIRIDNGFMAPSDNVQAEAAVATQELQVLTDQNN